MSIHIDNSMRVAIIGFGSMGRNHFRVLSEMDDVEIVAIVEDDNSQRTPSGTQRVNLHFLATLNLDYAVVSTPTSTHLEISRILSCAKINIFLEKPAGGSVQETEQIEKLARDNEIVIGVGYIENYNPAIVSSKTAIANGEIGRVLQISTVRQGPNPNRIKDVGVVKDLLCHDISIVLNLSNSQYIELDSRIQFLNQDDLSESAVLAIGTLNDRTIVSHQVNWISAQKSRTVSIHGTLGTLYLDLLNARSVLVKTTGVNNTGWPILDLKSGGVSTDTRELESKLMEPLVAEHLSFISRVKENDLSLSHIRRAVEVQRHLDGLLSRF
jgi:UDP-N-acetylglucosamine 3-dehydrogenase